MVDNKSRFINFVSGINGVAPGGNGLVNLPTNQRYHRLKFLTQCVNYTGGAGKAITALTGTGASATGTLTIVNGVPTAIAIVAGGTGWAVGDTFTIADNTGRGFVGTVATVTGGPPGALATATVTVAGVASPCDPATVLTSLQQLVNGVPVRDISPDMVLRAVIAEGGQPNLGELVLNYTDPTRNEIMRNDVTSWDLFGQSTFSIRFGISPTVTAPSVTGTQEFDFQRNIRVVGGKEQVFLEPVCQHQYGFNIPAGRFDITTLPFDFPISRLWIQAATAGSLSQLEIYQDNNKVFEATKEQWEAMYQPYGFQFGRATWFNQNSTASPQAGQFAQPRYFDAAYLSDPDGRWGKYLRCENSLVIRVYSDVPQQITILSETMPGAYV